LQQPSDWRRELIKVMTEDAQIGMEVLEVRVGQTGFASYLNESQGQKRRQKLFRALTFSAFLTQSISLNSLFSVNPVVMHKRRKDSQY